MRHIGWTLDIQLAHRLKPHVFALVGNFFPRAAFFLGAVNDLVVDIGDIRNQAHFKTRPFEVAAQNVVHQRGSTMTKVGWAVHSRAAQIDTDFSGGAQSEFADL